MKNAICYKDGTPYMARKNKNGGARKRRRRCGGTEWWMSLAGRAGAEAVIVVVGFVGFRDLVMRVQVD
jgi:hypothetical protein